MRRTAAGLGALLLLAAGCSAGAGEATADYPWYEDSTALIAAADGAVEGVVRGTRVETLDLSLPLPTSDDPELNPWAGVDGAPSEPEPAYFEVRIYEVDVARSFGAAPAPAGETIELMAIAADAPSVDDGGDTPYLFLVGEAFEDRPRSMLNRDQAVYVVADDGSYLPLDPANDVELRLTDLDALQRGNR